MSGNVDYYAVFTTITYFYFLLPEDGKTSESGNPLDYMYAGDGRAVLPDEIVDGNRWYSPRYDVQSYITEYPNDAEIRKGLETYYDGEHGRDKYEATWDYQVEYTTLTAANTSVDYEYETFDGGKDLHIDTSITITTAERVTVSYIVAYPDSTVTQNREHHIGDTVQVNSTVDLEGRGSFETDGFTFESEIEHNGSDLRETWTVTYLYTGIVPEGAPSVPESQNYVLNEPVKVAVQPVMSGWEFPGWSISDDFKMPGMDIVITGSWSATDVVTPDGGGDTPTPTPGGGGDGTPTPGTPATVTPADDTTTDEAASEETIADDDTALAAPTDTIGDDDTPLAAGAKDEDCWVHWLILLGMILSAVYFVGVGVRRRKFTSSLLGYEDKVLGNDRDNAQGRRGNDEEVQRSHHRSDRGRRDR